MSDTRNPPGHPAAPAVETLKRAAAALRAGRPAEAADLCLGVLATQPDHLQALRLAGTAAFRAGDPDRAVDLFGRAADLAGDAEGRIALANVLAAAGRLDEAEMAVAEAARLAPDRAEIHAFRADLCRRLERFDDAAAAYDRAIALDPSQAEWHANLGAVHRRRAEHWLATEVFAAAEAAYRRAIDLRPDVAGFRQALATTLIKADRVTEGAAVLAEAVRLASDDPRLAFRHAAEMTKIVPVWHTPMMNDAPRNGAYQRAIERSVTPECHVLEIGTGAGLLSMMAARAGARQVTTCELVPALAAMAREIIAANGFADRVTVVGKLSLDVRVGEDMPEQADVFISEILSDNFVSEGVVHSVLDARRRLLKPGARIIPAGGAIMAALVACADLEPYVFVDTAAGFDLGAFNAFVPRRFPLPDGDWDVDLLSAEQPLFEFDFTGDLAETGCAETVFTADRSGRCLGLLQWVRIDLDTEDIYENHPHRHRGPGGWRLILYPLRAPRDLAAGDIMRVRASYTADAQLFIEFL